MSIPGPLALGRGVVVSPGGDVPEPFRDAPRVRVDDGVLADPEASPALDALGAAWAQRAPVVVELAAGAADLKAPEVCGLEPWRLGAEFTFSRERLHFLVWANTYDARNPGEEPRWWHGVRAARLGAAPGGPADVVLADGTPAWCDGGPRQPPTHLGLGAGEALVHRDSIDTGRLTPARFAPPGADLAPDQLAAVAHRGGPARVIAPAGSGKTRVLTERIRHLIVDRGYEPDLVTAVAYNVGAAAEMRERTRGFTPTVRTLNSLALDICQRRGRFGVVEEREQRRLLDEALSDVGARRRGRGGGRRQVGTDPLAPYLDALSTVRLGLRSPEAAEVAHPDAMALPAVWVAYRERLQARGLLDFDEQIYRALELLLSDADLRAEVRAGARTLLVDEFQDLTPAHLLLVRLVAGPAADVFGVGDDDQVIYGYAGADPGFLIDFGRYLPGAAAYDLGVNYRCPPAIVGAARNLLSYNQRRVPKTITPAPQPAGGDSDGGDTGGGDSDAVEVRRVERTATAPAVLGVIEGWISAGADPADIAVLTRVNASLLPAQVLLAHAGIPYRAAVGSHMLDRPGAAAALAYLRMAAQPGRIAAADVRATVRRPSRGISPKAIDLCTRDPQTSLRSVRGLAGWMADKDSFARDVDRLGGYADDIEALAGLLSGGATTAQALAFVRADIGLGQALSTLDASKGTLDRSAAGDDLAALEQVAGLHPDPSTFETWLRRALPEGPAKNDGPGVHLATVHRVKGREWPLVVLAGADAGLFPHRLAPDEEEERRIFHVGITRARRAVVVVGDAASPSPFLDELATPAPPEWARRPGRRPERTSAPRPAGEPGATPAGFPATVGTDISFSGGRVGRIVEVRRGAAVVASGERMLTVDFGTDVRCDGRRAHLVAPPERVGTNTAALTAWRSARAKAENKPAYVFLSNQHLEGIAQRDPDTLERLARCSGVGPTRLDAYGEELLAVLAGPESER